MDHNAVDRGWQKLYPVHGACDSRSGGEKERIYRLSKWRKEAFSAMGVAMLTHDEIINLTQEYGGDWAVNHARRILHLISLISDGVSYNEEAVWLAAYLHDWGGYARWAVVGMEHQDRSAQVVEDFLREHDYPAELSGLVLECILNHHGGERNRAIESIMFTDADALDLLGVAGTLRIFSMFPRNLRGAWEGVQRWKALNAHIILLERSRQMAEKRFEETNLLLQQFEEETFGLF